MDLYSEPIEVELSEGQLLRGPHAFTWRAERHAVTETLSAWADTGFADGAKRHRWWERRHRNYFRVRTEEGSVWELYLDRSGSRRTWILSRRWSAEEAADALR